MEGEMETGGGEKLRQHSRLGGKIGERKMEVEKEREED